LRNALSISNSLATYVEMDEGSREINILELEKVENKRNAILQTFKRFLRRIFVFFRIGKTIRVSATKL